MSYFPYEIEDHLNEMRSLLKGLGLNVGSKLNLTKRIEVTASHACRKLGMVKGICRDLKNSLSCKIFSFLFFC